MDNALYSTFLSATRDVLKTMLDVNSMKENPGGLQDKEELSISIQVTGSLTGEIIYRFPKETSLNMVKIMSGGMDFEEVDDFVTSAVGEIANIISGKALISLSEQKIVCDILPPKILSETEDSKSEALDSGIRTQIQSNVGSIEIDIRLCA
ncbi:MAG: CheC-like family protein [Oscillospiraceae bacterium]|jgi:chemotaxis protein CheX